MLFLLINRILINRATRNVKWYQSGFFSQLMVNTGANDGNRSQDSDRGLQAVWRSINKQQSI